MALIEQKALADREQDKFRDATDGKTAIAVVNSSGGDIGSTTDVSDRAARLLGVVYGSQGAPLQQKVTSNDLIVTLDGETVAVTGTFWQATQPVSGTFWQATQPVSGTFWQTTQPISAVSLPLPSGAATSALQLPDGHNVTVDNAAGAAAVNIQDGGNTITVDGTVAVNVITGFATETTLAKLLPTTINEYNTTCTVADTEYSQALPAATKKIQFINRASYDLRYAFTTGKVAGPTAPYFTLKAGQTYFEIDLDLTSKTIYFASSHAGDVVELLVFS